MLAVEGLSKSYGPQVLFEKISFRLNRGERVGVVGKNGHGKSTLFRLIAGLEEPDEGRIIIPRNYRIGYLEQEPDFQKRQLSRKPVAACLRAVRTSSGGSKKS